MKKLIMEEFKKLKASRLVVILSIARIIIMIITGFIQFESMKGWPIAPVATMSFLPATYFFLYGIVVVKMVASEFENYVVGDAIRAGVGRKQYFVAKCISIVIYTSVLELLMTLAVLLVPLVRDGIQNGIPVSLKYVGMFLLFYFIMVVLICVMNSVAMLISYACKHFGLATAVIFVLFVIVDERLSSVLIDYVCGPLALIVRIIRRGIEGYNYYVLTGEFWIALIPSIIIGVAAVVASYIIFMKTEFASVEEREAEQK